MSGNSYYNRAVVGSGTARSRGPRTGLLVFLLALTCQPATSILAADETTHGPVTIERSPFHDHAFTRAVSVRFSNPDGAALAGELHLPRAGERPYPAVVFIHGAGGSANSPLLYPPIWRVFLDAGFAVFAWDSPGLGESEGDMWQQSLQDRADEVQAGIEALKRLDEVNSERIGLWAISQGGWIGPLVAAQRSDVAFMILVAAPAVPLISQDLFQIEHRMRADGNEEKDIHEALAFMKKTHALMLEGAPYQDYAPHLELVASRPWFKDYALHLSDARIYEFAKRNLHHDPVSPLRSISCPVLLIFGELDMHVNGPESEAIFRREFERAGNRELTVRYIKNADHAAFTSRTGGTRELMERLDEGELEYAPGYLSVMRDWLLTLPSVSKAEAP